MRLFCLLTCVVLLSACRMKEPAEGVLRVTVKYPSYRPQCLRVEIGDGSNRVGTDLPSDQLKGPDAKEVQVAMVRKAAWGDRLNVTVTSFSAFNGNQCAGALVEVHEDRALDAPPGKSIDWTVTLLAADRDGDGFVASVSGTELPDCDDSRSDIYPGAIEMCTADIDSDCDGHKSCEDSDCLEKPCIDGDVCHDPGSCNGSGACIGIPTPCPAKDCTQVAGCTRNSSCLYSPDPAQLNQPCGEDGSGIPHVCRADGQCVTFPFVPSNFDPNSIPSQEIGELRTTGAVVFDTSVGTWAPAGAGPDTGDFTIKTLPQSGDAPEILLIPVRTLALGGELRIVGSRPVIFAVYGDATLSHDILASGRIVNGAPVPGTGGNRACAASQGKMGTRQVYSDESGGEARLQILGGGGGGAGGATIGALGGSTSNTSTTGGDMGVQQASAISPLFGGCAGGNGVSQTGSGGAGGGAIQLSVARTLTIRKVVSVSGGGGLGGLASTTMSDPWTRVAFANGGGGGGSGGRIVLEAFQVNLTSDARLTANGGGGGEGGTADFSIDQDGANGANGSETRGVPATGGSGASATGGAGGEGGASNLPVKGAGGGLSGGGGGGGGGGAAGSINLRSVQPCVINASSVISPAPTGGCAPL
ncbi:hypothetical protein D7Y11_39485 [Corallococcus sp. AB018]|uniref:putative metal-binding motif-containing protein n=3 Tax=Corallococcus TaxID=83461 RepID=UPI000F85EDFB|nr:putative metal-binding motif-containing protein [Corallococcus sp. AB018]RUO87660.1 hypothetical protein D7Y11_39485 [Corallococcus sp. AB018]